MPGLGGEHFFDQIGMAQHHGGSSAQANIGHVAELAGTTREQRQPVVGPVRQIAREEMPLRPRGETVHHDLIQSCRRLGQSPYIRKSFPAVATVRLSSSRST